MQVAAAFKPAYPNNFKYKIINILDMPFINIARHFQQAISFMKEAMNAEGGGAVLVHCYAGVSRSASCVIAFLMQECGLTFLEAMTYVRKKRPIVFPNFGFQRQLMEFEKTLRAKNPHHFSLGGIKKPSTATTLAQRPQSSGNPNRGNPGIGADQI